MYYYNLIKVMLQEISLRCLYIYYQEKRPLHYITFTGLRYITNYACVTMHDITLDRKLHQTGVTWLYICIPVNEIRLD